MKPKVRTITALAALAALGLSSVSQASWPVIDVASIAKLVQQISTMKSQLSTMQGHLRQAQQEFQSITGSRGMQNLLAGTVRNYLPADWQALQATLTQTTSSFPALSASIQRAMANNAVLNAQQLAALSAGERSQVLASRQSVAMLQATTQQALSTISDRFTSIQKLVTAIGSAQDQKAILDLQARISAEQGMLENDQSKLQVIYQSMQAQQWATQQKNRELALADVGSLRSLPAMGL
ncbi:MAG: type IV secretion system family protein [Gammaproteobacteria bacterium]|nr:type IV secretion system family protein [Gammaproteobacteria bacterium]